VHPSFVNAAEMLAMPRTHTLSEEQMEGRQCVWCSGPDTIDMGPRLSTFRGRLHPWRPKGCEDCTRAAAQRSFNLHIRSCARCSRVQYCQDARALHALGWPDAHPKRSTS
jgi:hypothetical protein